MNLSLLFPQLRKILAMSAVRSVTNQGSANGNFLIIQSTTNSGYKSLSEENLYFFLWELLLFHMREGSGKLTYTIPDSPDQEFILVQVLTAFQ